MDPSWTNVFYDKLVHSKLITCSLVFAKSRLRKKNSRKCNTSLFQCHARCQERNCPIKVNIIMAQPISVGHNVIFRVSINGIPKHDNPSIKTARPLKGVKRLQMGN
jgi:hypothetical protein